MMHSLLTGGHCKPLQCNCSSPQHYMFIWLSCRQKLLMLLICQGGIDHLLFLLLGILLSTINKSWWTKWVVPQPATDGQWESRCFQSYSISSEPNNVVLLGRQWLWRIHTYFFHTACLVVWQVLLMTAKLSRSDEIYMRTWSVY